VILVLAVLVAALSVPLLGGSLLRLQRLKLRWPLTIAASLWIQVVVISLLPSSLPEAVSRSLHLASYVLALAFLWVNRRIPWLWLIGAGGLSNLVAIGSNGGVMPASKTALAAAGLLAKQTDDKKAFVNTTYHAGEHLQFLGDIFNTPRGWPLANVFSIGDVLIAVGALLLLHTVCGSRLTRITGPLHGSWSRGSAAKRHVAELGG
jgi:Family of unknown function (DUF5317)